MKRSIPIIDLADMGLGIAEEPKQSTIDRVSKELDEAFVNIGFVYLKNHGIDNPSVDAVLRASQTFFELPDSCKDIYRRNSTQYDGYSGVDQEILESKNLHEVREAYDITSLDSFFPDKHQPEFRKTVSELVPKLCKLSHRLLRCLAVALGLDEEYFTRCHTMMCQGSDKNATTFRTLFYPSLADGAIKAGVERCGQHSDYGTFTLLFQDDIGGLEVLSGGEWIAATPIPGTVLVNVGDLMQFWTANRYPATIHRVRVPEEEIRRRQPRQSLAFFVHPDNDVMVSPLNGSKNHSPISALAHLNLRYSQTYKY
ncbi:UPF0676 protein C1494.01-like isoform X2 [Daphnia pulicaria]|uniref:UPF0676 protein C1494.01-like isoform X2 n=1 Tax=Daphnia pulicaria TaxID=35523 RepID=UPI001EE9E0F9|nr:UPF0676 protein C1494.01-like isoform X2 [Daphnia pulicaria]